MTPDTANGGAGRFQSHVLDEKPTAITINFGMNDGGYGKFDEGRNKSAISRMNTSNCAITKINFTCAGSVSTCSTRSRKPCRDWLAKDLLFERFGAIT